MCLGDIPHLEADDSDTQSSFPERLLNLPRQNKAPVLVSIVMLHNTNIFVLLE